MNSTPEAYPLQWPLGHPRTEKPRKSQFVVSMAQARDGVLEQLRLWRATGIVLSSNAPIRKDGLPYSSFPAPKDAGVAVYFNLKGKLQVVPCDEFPAPKDAGVAVYFNLKGKLQVVPCDEYLTVAENMRAIQYVVEALRTIERHGGTGVFSTAFSGFQALPAKGETTGARWWDILEVSQDATLQEVQAAFFKLSKVYHPDVPGGSHEKMAALTEARKQALEILSSSQNSLN